MYIDIKWLTGWTEARCYKISGIKDACTTWAFLACVILCSHIMTESLPLLSDFEKMLLDRIEDLRGRIHKAHNPIYNETVMIEIETLQWVLSQIDRPKQ